MLYGGFDSLGYFSCFGEPRRCLASASPKGQADGLHGLIDEEGRWVVTPRWPSIDFFGDNGLARAGSEGHWVFINAEGHTVLEPAPGQRFESKFVHGRAIASTAGLAGFIDSAGRWTAPPRFAYLGSLSAGGLAVAREPDSTAMGYVDAEGRWRIPPAERLAHPFSSLGLAAVRGAEGCTTLIDANGDTVNAIGGQDLRWQPERCRVSRLKAGLERLALGQPVGATTLLVGTVLLALWLAARAARPEGARPVWRRTLRAWAAALLPSASVALALGVYRFITSGQLATWEGLTLPQRDLPVGVVLGGVSLVLAAGFGLVGSVVATVVVRWRRPTPPGVRS